jgi:hypothetical protein
MSVRPVLLLAREQFLEEWRDAMVTLSDDEARDFVLALKQRMTEMAHRALSGGQS